MFLLSGLKLIALPAIALGLAQLFDVDPVGAVCAVLCAALPTAKNQFIVSQKYHQNEELTANMVSLTTAASLVSLILWLLFLAHLYPGSFST